MLARARRQKRKGFSLLLTACCLTVMVGMFGLTVDLGRMYVVKSEVQAFADAAALAATLRLNGTSQRDQFGEYDRANWTRRQSLEFQSTGRTCRQRKRDLRDFERWPMAGSQRNRNWSGLPVHSCARYGQSARLLHTHSPRCWSDPTR